LHHEVGFRFDIIQHSSVSEQENCLTFLDIAEMSLLTSAPLARGENMAE
jgi:hypothetical protein